MPMKSRVTNFAGGILAEKRDGTRRLHRHDPLGSTIALVNESGVTTDTYRYWPYGEERVVTGTSTNPWRFGGKWGYHSEGANRSYVRARELRREMGRWMTVDMLWPEESAYGYVENSPLVFIDPFGCNGQVGAPLKPPIDTSKPPPWFPGPGPRGPGPVKPPVVGAGAAVCVGGVAILCIGWSCYEICTYQPRRPSGPLTQLGQCIANILIPWDDDEEIPVPPGTIRDPKQCTEQELRTRQAEVDKKCKDKQGKQRRWFCGKFKKGSKEHNNCLIGLNACIEARESVCECFINGCDDIHQGLIDGLKRER